MPNSSDALSAAQIDSFVADGFVRIDDAFPSSLAGQGRTILWRDTGCDPDDRSTWTGPVIRLGYYGQPPFVAAANTDKLRAAYDQLVGKSRWLPPAMLGTFPVRFPSPDDPGDAGWHIDMSFGTDNPDFMEWRADITSKGRALLMLFLFSDVGEDDAPTRMRLGSHLTIARQLEPAGERGLSLRELSADGYASTAHLPETAATGAAGTVYLPSIPRSRSAAASRNESEVHGAAPVAPSVPACAGTGGWGLFASGDRDPERRPMTNGKPASIDSYFAGFPPDIELILERIRDTIRAIAPDAVETIKYDMALFTFGGAHLYVGAWKRHVGLYPIYPAPPALEAGIAPYRAGKDTVHFLYKKPIPYDLIKMIVTLRIKQANSKG